MSQGAQINQRLQGVKAILAYIEQRGDIEITEYQVRYWIKRKNAPMPVRRFSPGGTRAILSIDSITLDRWLVRRGLEKLP